MGASCLQYDIVRRWQSGDTKNILRTVNYGIFYRAGLPHNSQAQRAVMGASYMQYDRVVQSASCGC